MSSKSLKLLEKSFDHTYKLVDFGLFQSQEGVVLGSGSTLVCKFLFLSNNSSLFCPLPSLLKTMWLPPSMQSEKEKSLHELPNPFTPISANDNHQWGTPQEWNGEGSIYHKYTMEKVLT